MGYTSPAFRSLIGTNNGIGSSGIIIDGTEEQKQKYLPRLASGELIASFALTEPDAGSDAAALKTTAVRDGDHYVFNGTKRFITNAPLAGMFTVMARTNPEIKGAGGISAFVVERDTPGLSLGKPDHKMGQKGALTSDVIFDNCRVPVSQLIGGVEGVGFKTAMKVLDKGRLHIAAICVGAAQRMLDDALRYAMERKQFGKPIAEFRLIQAMLADSKAEIYASRCMIIDAAGKRDEGRNVGTEASCAKMFASEMCGRVADRAVQIHGGRGLFHLRRHPCPVHQGQTVRSAKVTPTAPAAIHSDGRRCLVLRAGIFVLVIRLEYQGALATKERTSQVTWCRRVSYNKREAFQLRSSDHGDPGLPNAHVASPSTRQRGRATRRRCC